MKRLKWVAQHSETSLITMKSGRLVILSKSSLYTVDLVKNVKNAQSL